MTTFTQTLKSGLIAGSLALAASVPVAAEDIVPGATGPSGQTVLTFIGKEPPGTRCNNNLQVAAQVANTYQVPIQILSASMVEELPAPAVFYGDQLIAADGKDHNGMASYQMVTDILEIEGVPKHESTGLLGNEKVNKEFTDLQSIIKSGGK
ncbi:MAG: hypothetical protein ACLFRM_03045 [Guyparkeria sp.]|uniref:hypothetical protein n=1 Tax=Guyparkeria sp. TaxID=2035736 RepID=UPI00397918E2